MLIQQITNEVMNKLNNNVSYPVQQSNVAVNSGTANSVLIILNSNLKNLSELYSSIKMLNQRYKTAILLSSTASRVIGRENIVNNTGVSEVYEDNGTKLEELYSYDSIVLANLTISSLSKLANMINDCILTDVVINYLINKKPVYVGLDFLRYLISINPTATSAVQENILKLKKMGASEINISEIGSLAVGSKVFLEKSKVNGTQYKTLINAGAGRIGSSFGMKVEVPKEVANLIDHTLLKPDVTREQILELCRDAKQYEFASVCVNPGWVKLSAEQLSGSSVKVCTVIGFPLGATTPATKAAETREAIMNGADEIDMVINIGSLKAGEEDVVLNDIKGVVEAAQGHIVKVIIETSLLTDEEKVKACKLSKLAGAHYVKTSTGFSGGGATIADIALMRSVVGPDMGVKASGGVHDFNQAKNLLEVGATRIGASASIAIVSGGRGTGAY
jgi:deoxyribose-phosphate aldolase